MANYRAKMFNRRASSRQFMPDAVIDNLGLVREQTVADIGSGGGYYSLRFAKIVGNGGRIYAVDVDHKLLDYLRREAESLRLSSIKPILTEGFPTAIPAGSVDLVFVRNVYHHLSDPVGYFGTMKKCLKPGGKVAIIDYRENGGFSFHSLFKHSVSPAKVGEDMAKAGYTLVRSYDFIPEQYFMVFRPSGWGNPEG